MERGGGHIGKLLGQESLMDAFVGEAREKKLPIALFGCGHSLKYAFEFLRLNNLEPSLLVDNDPAKRGMEIGGLPVHDFRQFSGLPEKYAVLVVPQDLGVIGQIRSQLATRPVQDDVHSFDFINFIIYRRIQEESSFRDYALKNLAALDWLYGRLADEKSRATLAGFVSGRVTQDYRFYDGICVGDSYFDGGLVSLGDHEVFVDCGAFDGDTIRDLLGRVDTYREIYAFEADAENYAALERFVAASNPGNVRLFRKAVWHEPADLAFDTSNDMLSRVGGKETVEAVRLDDVVATPVTQIKMDIEGAEFEALLGARETIRKYRPRLTICVYHKYHDLTRIPLLIDEMAPGYKFHLRHHSPYGAELVLYAIAD